MTRKPSGTSRSVAIEDGTFTVDAAILAEMLKVSPESVPGLLRDGMITSRCERGTDEQEGEFRLSFFCGNLRARLHVDGEGHVLRRSVVDFGDGPGSPAGRRPG